MNQKGFAQLLFLAVIVLVSVGIIGASLLVKQMLVKQPEPVVSPSPIASSSPISQTIASSAAAEKSTKIIQLLNLTVAVKCSPDQEKTLLDADANYKNSVDTLEKCIKTLPVRGKLCADLCMFQKIGAQAECISPLEKFTPETLTKEVATQELQCNRKAIESSDQCLAKCEGFTATCPASLTNDPAYNNLLSVITQYCQS